MQRSGGRVRIVAQLGDGATGGQLWADRYDRDLADVFAIQDELAGKIGAAISAAVRPVEPEQWPGIAAKGTASVPAFDCFLRGRSMQRGATQNVAVFRRTVALFQEAIAHDPGYAAPYAALAMAHAHNHFNRWDGDPAASIAAAAASRARRPRAIQRTPSGMRSRGSSAATSATSTAARRG